MIDLARLPSLADLTIYDIEALQDRGARESSLLEFKRNLGPFSDRAKFELLKDLSGFANTDGGIVIFGVEQDATGAISGLPGVQIDSEDRVSNQVDSIVADNIEERIPGIHHRFIRAGDGRVFFVVRVPRSPLAPHMITLPTSQPRFYFRANTTTAPMTIAQVKDTVMRASGYEAAALEHVQDRHGQLSLGGASSLAIHAVPLYGAPYVLDIGAEAVARTLVDLASWFGGGSTRYGTAGLFVQHESSVRRHHTLFSRNGAIEYVLSPIVESKAGRRDVFPAQMVEQVIADVTRRVATTHVPGLVTPPLVLAIRVSGTRGSAVSVNGFPEGEQCEAETVDPPAEVVHSWAHLDAVLVRFYGFLWQAYGVRRSPTELANHLRRGLTGHSAAAF